MSELTDKIDAAQMELKTAIERLKEAEDIDQGTQQKRGGRELSLLHEQAIDLHVQGAALRARLDSEL